MVLRGNGESSNICHCLNNCTDYLRKQGCLSPYRFGMSISVSFLSAQPKAHTLVLVQLRKMRWLSLAVVGGEGGDQRLPARPDRQPCRSFRESAGSGGPPTPSSSLRYCGQDAASRRRLCHMPTTLRYIFLRNLPCSTAPAPFVWILFYFRPLFQSHLDFYYY